MSEEDQIPVSIIASLDRDVKASKDHIELLIRGPDPDQASRVRMSPETARTMIMALHAGLGGVMQQRGGMAVDANMPFNLAPHLLVSDFNVAVTDTGELKLVLVGGGHILLESDITALGLQSIRSTIDRTLQATQTASRPKGTKH